MYIHTYVCIYVLRPNSHTYICTYTLRHNEVLTLFLTSEHMKKTDFFLHRKTDRLVLTPPLLLSFQKNQKTKTKEYIGVIDFVPEL